MKNILFLVLVLGVIFGTNAQMNDYKYIIIPKRLKGFKEDNQYLTSTRLKHLFVEASYNAVYDDAFPQDLKEDFCLAVKADLKAESSLFSTKLRIEIKDCEGKIVFTSELGKSKEKEYKNSYTEAMVKAFESFKALNYKYQPKKTKSSDESIVSNSQSKQKPLRKTQEVKSSNKVAINVIKEETTTESNSYKSPDSNASKIKKDNQLNNTAKVLYAQPIANGFQLVDSTPTIQFKLVETSIENVFLATQGDKNGVVLKKNDTWFFEYKEGDKKVLKELTIKF